MIVATMPLEDMIAEARKDYPAIRNKLINVQREARRDMIRTKQARLHMIGWTSQRKNDWLLLLVQRKKGTSVHTLTWFHDLDGGINALVLADRGMVYRIDRHVIERYRQRFNPATSDLERLRDFFTENYAYSCQPTGEAVNGRWSVQVGMNQGMCLGYWEEGTEVVHADTFINHGQMFAQQLDDMDRMDMERWIRCLSPGQRRWMVAEWKRQNPTHIGTPGMQWLESLAA
ncbi:MAG: hypothetical protein JNM62_09190 [Flavobacteriales bacterium]|nr:hypothetical protein [Flavobacteriales bacterium]